MLKKLITKLQIQMPYAFESWTRFQVGIDGVGISWEQRMNCLEDFDVSDRGIEHASQQLGIPQNDLVITMHPMPPKFIPWQKMKNICL